MLRSLNFFSHVQTIIIFLDVMIYRDAISNDISEAIFSPVNTIPPSPPHPQGNIQSAFQAFKQNIKLRESNHHGVGLTYQVLIIFCSIVRNASRFDSTPERCSRLRLWTLIHKNRSMPGENVLRESGNDINKYMQSLTNARPHDQKNGQNSWLERY